MFSPVGSWAQSLSTKQTDTSMGFFFNSKVNFFYSSIATAIAFFAPCALHPESVLAEDKLTIGSPAPALDIEHWVSDRNGEMPHVKNFEEGKVYIVEFWATWCGPCIMSMPHLAETQAKYAEEGVQLISVSDEDLETVEKFLQRKVRGKKDKTYGELTSAYCLTTDPDESVSKDYMRAAGQNGIPTAFIVGKSGLIEWIGHPMEMDGPLEAIVGGKWDREKFAVNFKKGQEFEKLASDLWDMKEDGKAREALAKLDEFMADLDKESPLFAQCTMIRLDVLLEVGGPEAIEAFDKFTSESKNAQMINQLAWGIVEKAQAGEEVGPKMLQAACAAAKRAVELSRKEDDDEGTAMVLDTHANLLFLCGKLDKAIMVQEEAAKLSDDPQIEKFLRKLKNARKKTEV